MHYWDDKAGIDTEIGIGIGERFCGVGCITPFITSLAGQFALVKPYLNR